MNKGIAEPVLIHRKEGLHWRAWPTLLPFVAPACPIQFLQGGPSSTDAPYPGAPQKNQHCPVDFSFHNRLPKGALRCFHPWVFHMSFHSLLIWGV